MATRLKGGKAWKRFMDNSKRAQRVGFPRIELGFLDRHISILASRLEFGDPSSDLPERPAFRQGVSALERALPGLWRDALGGQDWRQGVVVSESAATKVAIAARDILRRSYETFAGPGLSERQEARKRGTPFAGRELVGAEGPKLIGHLEARVNGRVVAEAE